jgi:hypothetical protein
MITITGSWLGEATVDGVTAQIPIKVTWSGDDPLVLACEFDGTPWEIGRDLIREAALKAPLLAGQGDVKAYIQNESLTLALHTDLGMAKVWMPWWRMKDFLSKAYNIIPQGEEKLGVDSAIEKILEGAE